MDIQAIMKSYLEALNQGKADKIITLFNLNGMVNSPLYGMLKATEFYQELLKDTSNSRIEFKNSFISQNTPFVGAIQFVYHWTLESGQEVTFDCMDVFEFDGETSKIEKLTIIYDTYPIRKIFMDMKNSQKERSNRSNNNE